MFDNKALMGGLTVEPNSQSLATLAIWHILAIKSNKS